MSLVMKEDLPAANRLCLDFVNLACTPGDPRTYALSWPEVIDFLMTKGTVSPERGVQLAALTVSDPEAADNLLRQAQRLEHGLRMSLGAILREEPIAENWVRPINDVLRITEGHDELEAAGTGWRMGFRARHEGLEWLLAAIARSGAELIAEGPTGALQRCSNPQCQLMYYDSSQTHRRRWCSMEICGNRNKVAAFAKRRTETKARAHHA